jgi:hypothetical protein
MAVPLLENHCRKPCCDNSHTNKESTYLEWVVLDRFIIFDISLDALLAAIAAVTTRPTILAPIAGLHVTEAFTAGKDASTSIRAFATISLFSNALA